MTVSVAATTTQVFRVHIKATPENVWEAITSPEWTARYGYRTAQEYELKPGGTFRALANDGMKAVGTPDVVVEGAPIHLALVTGDVVQGGGGWPFILSDLKSLLETGSAMGG